ncbi:SDR family NAD(P)-dependent oxidoreductase [Cryptosporangium sp. NPDC051539]|uniref:SDR family NAD(P)-dependent oxidoreductase n=1 Tax=Cryptosporangium sp. NPDC051539 TaxID=3363962 RepID=UPI0037A82F9C
MAEQALTGAVALVTGASSGIGAATARHLGALGATVALVARRRDRLDRLADDILASGGGALAIECDLTEPGRARQLVGDTVDLLGRLDILVNNAAVMRLDTALHTTIEEWDRMVALNVSALLHTTYAAVPYLIDGAATSPRHVTDLVNVSSTAGRVARPGGSVYALTKFGLNGFTEALRQELLVEGVRVSVVAPGAVAAEPADHVDDAVGHRPAAIEPLRAEDIADAIGYIVTRERRVAVNEMLVRAGEQTW